MPNLHRGEIEAEIGGARRRLVLTLGALAELEAAFGADDLTALAERFGAGRLKAIDLARIIGAASAAKTRQSAMMRSRALGRRGATAYVRIAAAPLAATFGAEERPWGKRCRCKKGAVSVEARDRLRACVLRLSLAAFWRMTPRGNLSLLSQT